MTTNDEWAVKTGRELALAARAIENTGDFSYDLDQVAADIAAFGCKAIERGKAIAGLLNAEELAVAVDKAVVAERERLLDRLRNPDEALLTALGTSQMFTREDQRERLAALARTLTEGKDNSDG